jgi:predicted O-methyltransferase YrrM
VPPRAQNTSRFGPPINIEEEMRTGAIAYWQGEYYQSRADKEGVSLLDYIHALFGLVAQKEPQSVLMIGCAGGSLATMLTRHAPCKVTAVDVNPQSFVIARRYFGLPLAVQCHVADGLDFLSSTRRMFDAIVLDAFLGGELPEELISEIFFNRAHKRLRKDGAIFVNVHVTPNNSDAADRVAQRMAEVLSEVRILDRPKSKIRNAIIMAGAVRGLRKPRIVMEPRIESRMIARVLGAMAFRPRKRAIA